MTLSVDNSFIDSAFLCDSSITLFIHFTTIGTLQIILNYIIRTHLHRHQLFFLFLSNKFVLFFGFSHNFL